MSAADVSAAVLEVDWALDLDLKSFFDSLDHSLVLKAVAHHTDLPEPVKLGETLRVRI